MAQALSEADVIKMIDSLSNWGRWGADDQLGTINLVTTAIAPLRLQNTTGSPVNPIAVF